MLPLGYEQAAMAKPGHYSLAFGLLLLAVGRLAAAVPIPSPPSVDGDSYLLVDQHSGRELVAHDADKRVEPASITKVMTAYAVFRALDNDSISLDDEVLVSEKAWRLGGSKMFIEVDTRVSVEDLLKGVIVQSGNDASVALAEHVAGTEDSFADLMNRYADELGMENTHYVNATGLPDTEHFTTARDTAILTRALIEEFPDYYQWFAIKEFTYNNISQDNRNPLLWRDKHIDGVKTGHTESAGYCLVAAREENGMRLISVVMGSSSGKARADANQALLNYGFRFYATHRLYAGDDTLTTERVWKGERETVALGLRDDLFVTVPRGSYKKLEAVMDVPAQLSAPVTTSAPIGKVRVNLEGEQLATAPLYALEPVAEGGLWTRLVDGVLLWFE